MGCRKVFGSIISIKTVCISLVLVSCIVTLGCTMTPGGSEGTIPVTSLPAVTTSPVPAPTLQPTQSIGDIQLAGNVYALSSDPLRGIDTITFSIGLPAHASAVDLTRTEIVFSAQDSAPVTLVRGTRDSTSIFTTTTGGNAVTALIPGDEVDISFRVKPVSGGATVNIEVRPPGGAALPISRTVPAMIVSMNVL
jgi:archaellin